MADVVYSRTTSEILSATNLSTPEPETILPTELLYAFTTIFGPDISTGTLTEEDSATGELLFSYIVAFSDDDPGQELSEGTMASA
jgi:hypothetical protein